MTSASKEAIEKTMQAEAKTSRQTPFRSEVHLFMASASNGGITLQPALPSAFPDNPYIAASGRRSLMSWHVSGMSADQDLNASLPTIRNRAQDLFRNSSVARAAINRIVENTVGPGLRMRSNLDRKFLGLSIEQAREWKYNVEREFQFWAESVECDYERQMTFSELQRLACKSQNTRGDCFALLPWVKRPGQIYQLRVQLIEADRVSNPQGRSDGEFDGTYISGGIERDKQMVPVAVHICDRYPGTILGIKNSPSLTWKRVPIYGKETGRRNVLRIMTADRIGQSRGEPILTPVVETLKQLSRYSEAELSAAVVNALLSVFIKRPPPNQMGGGFMGDDDAKPWEDLENKQLGSGTWIDGAPGEELQIVAANRPNAQYEPFFIACMKQIGMALGIPFEVLINHFSSSYSASRAAILEAYKHFKITRKSLQTDFCQPVYEEWLLEAIIKGRIHAPGFLNDQAIRAAYCQALWIGPTSGQIDPVKEVEAANLRVLYKFSTRGIETAEMTGLDFEDVAQAQAEEIALQESLGLPVPEAEDVRAQKEKGETDGSADGTKGGASDVQDLALNGAQTQALQGIVEGVAAGMIPHDTAKAMIKIAFPHVEDGLINAMIDPIVVREAASRIDDEPHDDDDNPDDKDDQEPPTQTNSPGRTED